MHDAKTNFSKLVARVEAGEEIIIGRAGTAVAKLVPIDPPDPEPRPRRPLGSLAGKITIHDTFDDPWPEELMRAFSGENPIDPEPRPEDG